MLPQSPQARGLLLATLGVLALTPDTLLVRLVKLESMNLLFWRGLFTLLGMSLAIALQYRAQTLAQFRGIGRMGMLTGFLMGCSSCCFVISLYFTSVSNTLVILASSPMFAALYSRLFLGEKIPLRTLITMVVVVCSVSIIVGDGDRSSLLGNCIALCAAICMSAGFTIMRSQRDRNMVPATALGGVVLVVVGGSMAPSLAVSYQQLALLLCMGASSVCGFFLITTATQYITSPEVSLLMPIETVLASYLVWLVIGEVPSLVTVLGGALIITTLSYHSFLSLRLQKDKALL